MISSAGWLDWTMRQLQLKAACCCSVPENTGQLSLISTAKTFKSQSAGEKTFLEEGRVVVVVVVVVLVVWCGVDVVWAKSNDIHLKISYLNHFS